MKTYLDSPDNPIDMTATMGVMADGIIYTQSIDLTASAKNLEITVNNSDYQRIAQ